VITKLLPVPTCAHTYTSYRFLHAHTHTHLTGSYMRTHIHILSVPTCAHTYTSYRFLHAHTHTHLTGSYMRTHIHILPVPTCAHTYTSYRFLHAHTHTHVHTCATHARACAHAHIQSYSEKCARVCSCVRIASTRTNSNIDFTHGRS
jgi:hypothetical protein